jgi:hypothetical protein
LDVLWGLDNQYKVGREWYYRQFLVSPHFLYTLLLE